MAVCSFDFAITVRKIPQILGYIKNLDAFIEKSKQNGRCFSIKKTFCCSHRAWFHFVCWTGSRKRHSMATHTKLAQRIERMSALVNLIILKISSSAAMFSPLLVTLINYVILGLGDESFRFDGTLWFPFDVNQPIGFFVAICFQGTALCAVLCSVVPIVCVYVGSCWCIVTFLRDTARDISHLKVQKLVNLKKRNLIERLQQFVQFHSNVEELSFDRSQGSMKTTVVTKITFLLVSVSPPSSMAFMSL